VHTVGRIIKKLHS